LEVFIGKGLSFLRLKDSYFDEVFAYFWIIQEFKSFRSMLDEFQSGSKREITKCIAQSAIAYYSQLAGRKDVAVVVVDDGGCGVRKMEE
jgi:hypothetical protein